MNISGEVKNTIELDLINKTKNIYDKFLLKKLKITVENFINEVFSEVVKSLEQYDAVDTLLLDSVKERRKKTKKRWLKKELNNIDSSLKDLDFAYKSLNKINDDNLKIIYGNSSTPEEFKTQLLEKLDNWCKDHEQFLIEFSYLDNVSTTSIKTALKNDIIYFTLNYLIKNSKDDNLITIPNTYINIPVDCSKRTKLELTDSTFLNNKQYLINDYYIDDDNIFRTLVGAEDIKKEALAKAVSKTFNTFDHKIFTYVMSLRDDDFLSTQKITVNIGDIVNNVLGSDGVKNYDAVKLSLLKMGLIKCIIVTKNKNGATFGLFDSVQIVPSLENKKREIAHIKIGDCIISDFVNRKTISYYKDKFTNLSDISNVLAIHLQKIRLSKSEIKNKNIEIELNYNNFRSFINLGKRKKSNFKLIADKLAEIKNNNIIIKDFALKADKFYITFYPLSTIERKDLLNTIPFVDEIKINDSSDKKKLG